MPEPLVSIAIRAYRRRWLAQAIDSVLSQTHRHLEVVIYDDAGELDDVAAAAGDPRLRYHRAPPGQTTSQRFANAVALCRGDVIGVLDDDDHYAPSFVARLLYALHEHPTAGVAFCRTTWDDHGRQHRPHDPRAAGLHTDAATAMLRDGWTVSPSHLLLRRAAIDAAMAGAAMPGDVAPDVHLNLRIAIAGWQHVLVDAHLVTCRWHAESLSHRGTAASDMGVATWQRMALDDPHLQQLRDRRLARALLVRAFERLRDGDRDGSRADLRAANDASAETWPRLRAWLSLAASSGAVGTLAARAWFAWAPAGRRRRHPAPAIGDRALPLA